MKTLLSISLAITGAFLFSYAVFAFDAPTADPPGSNIPTPINVGPDAQVKSGGLWVDSLGVDGDIVDGSGSVIFDSGTRKIRESFLPFSKGDIVAPGDRSLISGLSSYATQYLRLNNLGISGTSASKVQCGQTFGPNNQVKGTYCQFGTCNTSTSICEEQSRGAFITSSTWKGGSFGGLSGADDKCQLFADNAGLGGQWKAWISDQFTSASARLTHSTIPYKMVNGAKIAENWSDLTDGRLAANFNITQTGTLLSSGVKVWTNTTKSGSMDKDSSDSSQEVCAGWTFSGGWPHTGPVGDPNRSDSDGNGWWTDNGRLNCNLNARLYCLEQ